MNQRKGERCNRGEYRSQSWVEKTTWLNLRKKSPVYKLSLCVELEKMPLITFWNKFVRDDNSSIAACISFNSLWSGAISVWEVTKGSVRPESSIIAKVLDRSSTNLNFDLDWFILVRSSELLNTNISPILLLLQQAGCVWANRTLFRQTGLQKMQELYILSCLEAGLVSPKRTRKTACTLIWRIFSSNKSAPANRKKGFYTTHLPKKKEEWRFFWKLSGSELWTTIENSSLY